MYGIANVVVEEENICFFALEITSILLQIQYWQIITIIWTNKNVAVTTRYYYLLWLKNID